MMTNLFTIFDPSSSNHLSLNWLSIFLITMYLPFQFWLVPSRMILTWTLVILYIYKEFKILISYSFSNLIMFISLMSLIFFNNFLGLFPYIFTASSHMNFCLSLSLTFWLSMIMYSMFNYFNNFMAHLTPQGTPSILMPFMVLIESISLIIRPFTLAIRLTANMVAGHLLLSLLGNSGSMIGLILLTLTILSQIMLFILEISVSLIQAYVFSILSTLYSSDT
uniref:ATP synthase subunit a n=1 Tax=Meranoplus bicolor TaxID=611886 RepID=A0A8K1RGP1_9HYME|nr:ATP synthase F0 subunit 6 [Meranoplus bicolor]